MSCVTDAEPIRLYRWYDQDGRLLYVGISSRPYDRAHQHVRAARWTRWATRMEIDPAVYADRADALRAEAIAITSQSPVFNIAGAVAYWTRINPYLTARGADPVPEPRGKTPTGSQAAPTLPLHPDHPLTMEITQVRELVSDAMAAIKADPDRWQALASARDLADLLRDLAEQSTTLRSQIAVEIYDDLGLSLGQLGDRLGVTRARAHQIVAAGRERIAKAS